jgi:uncharacterized protein YdcH (DUF465 family)
MKIKEEELKKRLMIEDEEYRRLSEEHEEFERQLDQFNNKSFLTPAEEMERKKIQKLKLAGKDRMEMILSTYRNK